MTTLAWRQLGIVVYALAAIATGIMDAMWRDFDPAHQPIQALGGHIPGRALLAYVTAIWLIVGGALFLWRRTERSGAAGLVAIQLIVAVFWLPRFVTAPRVLGFGIPVYVGVFGGLARQMILVMAAMLVLAPRTIVLARWIFGLASIDFGLAHFTSVREIASEVPKWMAPGGEFWAIVSAIAFILAGAAILAGIRDVLAARLLGVMFVLFSALIFVPATFAAFHSHVVWGGDAYNFTAAGATWIYAAAVAAAQNR